MMVIKRRRVNAFKVGVCVCVCVASGEFALGPLPCQLSPGGDAFRILDGSG